MKKEKKINGEALKARILQCEKTLTRASTELGLCDDYLSKCCRKNRIYDYVANLLRLRYGIVESEYAPAPEEEKEEEKQEDNEDSVEITTKGLQKTIVQFDSQKLFAVFYEAMLKALKQFDEDRKTAQMKMAKADFDEMIERNKCFKGDCNKK